MTSGPAPVALPAPGRRGRPAPSPSRFDHDLAGLAAVMEAVAPGQPAYRSRQLWEAMHQRGEEPGAVSSLPAAVRTALAQEPSLRPALELAAESEADDGETVKWLWRLAGGATVETVLMHYRDRTTVCVSTQAGCAMACSFCATGQAGFTRHLTTGEIVEQVVRAQRRARESGRRLGNVVFMGMGEPLANYGPVWGALRRLHADVGLSARHLTVSTVGLVPASSGAWPTKGSRSTSRSRSTRPTTRSETRSSRSTAPTRSPR